MVDVELTTNKIKVAKGYIPVISYSYTYDKDNFTIDEQKIHDKIIEYTIDLINKNILNIKTTKNMFVNSSVNDIFESVSMSKPIRNIFGPLLYDTRVKKSVNIIENMSKEINIDKIKDILSAA